MNGGRKDRLRLRYRCGRQLRGRSLLIQTTQWAPCQGILATTAKGEASDDRVPQKVEVVYTHACVRLAQPRTLQRDSLVCRRSEPCLRQAPRAHLNANASP